jgi:hypothetical protein
MFLELKSSYMKYKSAEYPGQTYKRGMIKKSFSGFAFIN